VKNVLVLVSVVACISLVGCSSNKGGTATPVTSSIPVPSSVLGTQGSLYTIAVFAQAPGDLQPDDLIELNGSIWVVCQDPNINPDGTIPPGVTNPQSKEIQYDLKGNVLQTLNLPGHPDGEVAYDSSTLWVSSNEDGNAIISVINTTTNTVQSYTSDVAVLPHGGGLDDLKVINGVVYASASSPTTTFSPTPNLAPYSTDGSGATAIYGVNTGPALYSISLNADGVTFHSTPVLMSSTAATLLPSPGTPVTLNMTDADSSELDPAGDLVMASQQDSELVFIKNVGTATQSVSVLPMTLYGNPWPLDDTRWSPTSGSSFMLLSDPPAQLIYEINATGGFQPNTPFSSGQGTVLLTDTSTGELTPIYVGMNNPHGLIFVSPAAN
jgi:hypothetical protein